MSYDPKGRLRMPNLQRIHIERLYVCHKTQLSLGKELSFKKRVKDVMFFNNRLASTVHDLNTSSLHRVVIQFRSARIQTEHDIDMNKSTCTCLLTSNFCADIAATLLYCRENVDTTSDLTCCMYIFIRMLL